MTATTTGSPSARWWLVMRKYPPSVGGMERLSFNVATRLAQRHRVELVARADRASMLPLFIAATARRLAAACVRRDVALVHLGDAVLAPLGIVARRFGVPCAVMLHGLDVVHDKRGYPLYRKLFLRGFDAYICNSAATRRAALDAGIPGHLTHVIGAGVDVAERTAEPSPRDLDCVLFVGRLVRRKGLGWFVTDVLPLLARRHPRVRLVVVGEGPERTAIAKAAVDAGVAERISWLGAASDDVKATCFSQAGVCVLPNIPVAGDMEGFGIVALESAAAGCPVVAADLEGLRDAIDDGESGALVPAGDAHAWAAALQAYLADPAVNADIGERARRHVRARRGWDAVIDAYDQVLLGMVNNRGQTGR